ncbi:23S rRNA (adenine(2030)-N(6))-methyltransferase RlmJ [Oceanospirillum maris]|uniref:23S rRNA (adenine(2030)-N(6))-methyltransferase RlmJ n=1 Tax=Oceanospirillum maris TaxID=64977 RepID=UPI0003F76D72|nr:23S rRNA (adenine(2030)-N(6))-methyltransferase RlmJ [Oceanospirillum maris]
MLSYRHAYHAGNHADVIKHLTMALIFQAMHKKAKPFAYIDTHSGGVDYDLLSDEAVKTGEAYQGILRVMDHPALPAPYRDLLHQYNGSTDNNIALYPGSPAIGHHFQRDGDKLYLMELHNNETSTLKRKASRWADTAIHHRDGFEGLPAIVPPEPRRGLVLMDPSYEIKTDYNKAYQSINAAYKRWPTGIFALWYPVLIADKSQMMLDSFERSGIRRILMAEISRDAQEDESFGMIGSGMMIINPPYQLDEQLSDCLPALAKALLGDTAVANVRWLVGE